MRLSQIHELETCIIYQKLDKTSHYVKAATIANFLELKNKTQIIQ